MKRSENKAYIVPHTHWDREWRYPIWKSRVLLVKFMDELLETLEKNPGYTYFHLDGQVIIIEDYLELRPEKEAQIVGFIKEGRLGIGPFYTLPDLYPIDGECIVRNMQKGMETASKYGGYVKVGYHSFGWGQISQFPQIYNDLGFDFLITAKYLSKERAPEIEFLWEGPDGSQIVASRLGEHGRANFYFNSYIQIKHGVDYNTLGFKYEPGKNKSALHNANPEKQNQDYFTFEPPDLEINEQYIQSAVQKAWDGYAETTVPTRRLILNGSDFSSCQPALPEIIEKANTIFDDISFVHSSLQQYVDDVLPMMDKKKLKTIKGELRDGGPDSSSANALTIRMYLKILNRKAQNLLIKQAEPLAALLFAEGCEYPHKLLETAWNYMFQSHAHDTINGVTQDKTADDAEYRLSQVIEIAESILDNSLEYLADKMDCSLYKKDDLLLLVINTLPQQRSEVIKLIVDIPREKNVWDFVFADENDNELTVQHISRKERTSPVYEMDSRSWPYYHDRHEVCLETGNIPAGGYKTLKLIPKNTFKREAEWWPIVKTSKGDEISQAPGVMENEFLYVEFDNGTGTINMTCKVSGRKYKSLHYFIDEGDMGDYWVNYPHYHNRIFDSRSAKHNTWTAENGPLTATVAVEIIMELPAFGSRPDKGIEGESKRSSETKTLRIVSEFTLKKGDKKLHVKTTVKNNIRDHRLRLCLPTEIDAECTNADGHFIVENRPVQPQKSGDGEFYPGMQSFPMQKFVTVSDGEHGFAFLTNSTGEYEMLRDKKHTLVLTLFRSVENRICSEYRSSGYFPEQNGGQNLRDMVFEYAFMPYSGDWTEADVSSEANRINVPLLACQFSPSAKGMLPFNGSMFSLTPSVLQVSALKKSEKENALLLRIYNPAMKEVEGKISFSKNIEKVVETSLIEEEKSRLHFMKDSFSTKFEKGKIKTFKIVFK